MRHFTQIKPLNTTHSAAAVQRFQVQTPEAAALRAAPVRVAWREPVGYKTNTCARLHAKHTQTSKINILSHEDIHAGEPATLKIVVLTQPIIV